MASFQYTTIGAGIGAGLGGLPGAIVGGLLGGFLDMFNYATQQQADWTQAAADAARIQAEQTALAASLLGQETALIGQRAQLGIQKGTIQQQLEEAQDKASAYQTFLSKIPTAGEALTESTGDIDFDRQYRALLGNLGNLNVLAGATGNVGPGTSMALVQEAGKADVGSFVGATQDLTQRQLDIFNTSASMLTGTLTTIGQTDLELADALAELEILKNTPPPTIPAPSTTPSIADWWNDPNNWLNPAHWFD